MQSDHTRRANDVDLQVSRRVRALRRKAGMTQEELAAALNVSFQQVQRYETGVNRMGVSKLFEIAAALDVGVQDLFADLPEVGTRGEPASFQTAEGRLIDQLLSEMKSKQRTTVLAFARSLLTGLDE